MKERMLFLFSNDEVSRISLHEKYGKVTIFIDVHGLKVREARRLIKNVISLNREKNDICVIHGFNHGTAIKEMISEEDFGNVTKKEVKGNKGRTLLLCA